MAGSVNKVILVGNLGRDPESRTMQSGGKVVTFSIATGETWTDKASGERKERTQWHRIVIYNDRLGEIAERFLKKGAKIYIEGALESRKFTDKDGQERETTEVVLRAFRGELTMLDGRAGGGEAGEMGGGGGGYNTGTGRNGGSGGGAGGPNNNNNAGGTPTAGQGFAGAANTNAVNSGSGGGGAGAAGSTAGNANGVGGAGGAGAVVFTGSTFASGGGGSGSSAANCPAAVTGGGGRGGTKVMGT